MFLVYAGGALWVISSFYGLMLVTIKKFTKLIVDNIIAFLMADVVIIMRKYIVFMGIFWAGLSYGDDLFIPRLPVAEVKTQDAYSYFKETDEHAFTKSSCHSVVCINNNSSSSIELASTVKTPPIVQTVSIIELPKIKPNETMETLGEFLFIMGQRGLADNCRDQLSERSPDPVCDINVYR